MREAPQGHDNQKGDEGQEGSAEDNAEEAEDEVIDVMGKIMQVHI